MLKIKMMAVMMIMVMKMAMTMTLTMVMVVMIIIKMTNISSLEAEQLFLLVSYLVRYRICHGQATVLVHVAALVPCTHAIYL